MRATSRCLQAVAHASPRSQSTSFIGLGRMGYQMALNLFSKQYKQDPSVQFIVCDALPESANAFTREFSAAFPDANIGIAATPGK